MHRPTTAANGPADNAPTMATSTVMAPIATQSAAAARRRRDRIASALIAIAVVAVVGWTWLASPARKVDRTEVATDTITAGASQSAAAQDAALMPRTLRQVWSTEASASASVRTVSPSPLVMGSTLVVAEERGVRAVSLNDGSEIWHYRRDIELCGLSGSDGQVYATFRGPAGCGETVALDPDTGAYKSTRRSIASDSPLVVRSNSYAGVYDSKMLELWRSDLVRVVEYGEVPATPEPKLQPHAECTIVSALTRVKLLAVVNDCDGQARLVLQEANPKESRTPEVKSDIMLGPVTDDLSLVAIGQDSAAVLMGDHVRVFRDDGAQLSDTALSETALDNTAPPAGSGGKAAGATAADAADLPHASVTADLPHQMTWWSPRGLMGFRPSTLAPAFEFAEATGTPAPWGQHILMPVADGIAVINSLSLEIIGTLALPTLPGAPGAAGSASVNEPVRLAVVGDTLLVQRGASIDAFAIEG